MANYSFPIIAHSCLSVGANLDATIGVKFRGGPFFSGGGVGYTFLTRYFFFYGSQIILPYLYGQ